MNEFYPGFAFHFFNLCLIFLLLNVFFFLPVVKSEICFTVHFLQATTEALPPKKEDIEHLKDTGSQLTTERNITARLLPLDKSVHDLENQVARLREKHNKALELWNVHKTSLEQVQESIQKAEYATSRGKVVMGSAGSLHAQTNKLKVCIK